MLPDGRRLGAHLPLGSGMVRAVERAAEIGASAIQIFGDNPTAWRRRVEPPREQPAFRARLAELDIRPVTIHAAYLVNLAGPDPDFFERSVEVLARELQMAPGFGATFVNVHTGSHRDAGVRAGTERIAEGVVRSLAATEDKPDDAVLLLENSAGGGFGIGVTVEELAGIAAAIAACGIPERRVGFCLDTAHAWG
ncbi:MAG TPA: TIM barrel protein, partial [Candidatus Dormibacteraeota bacterium]|nr:TIM barrel protein [Candidatus Dormibacteraeota bacterium]